MAGPILYSVNPWYSLQVAKSYRAGVTYAWCSEYFSSGDEAFGAAARMIAASSDPKTIYQQLSLAVATEDEHDSRIKEYRKTFKRLAAKWLSDGSITQSQFEEINAVCRNRTFRIWRPMLYIIPRTVVASRMVSVPRTRRAGHGEEFTVDGLLLSEIDVIELPGVRI